MYSCISSSFRLSTECFVKKLYRQRPMQPALRLLSLICDGPVLQLRARYVLYFNHNRTFIVCSSSVHPAILFQNVELGSAPPWSARGVVQPEHAGYGYHQWNGNPSSPAFLLIMKSIGETSKMGDLHTIRMNLDTAALYLLRLLGEKPAKGQLSEATGGKLCDDAFQYR